MKLLVNTPAGEQSIVSVDAGGGYFDITRVLWDERKDGPLPDITLGAMVRIGDALKVDATLLPDPSAVIEQERGRTLAAIEVKAAAVRDAFVSPISPAEMSSWPLKLAQAQRYTETQDATEAPSLAAEATVRGIDLADLVGKVLDKAAMLAQLEAVIAGTAGKKSDAAKAAPDLVTLQQVGAEIDNGWPPAGE
jgi:hypothetical protein